MAAKAPEFVEVELEVSRPRSLEGEMAKLMLNPEALEMLLSGVDLKDGMQRAWFEESQKTYD